VLVTGIPAAQVIDGIAVSGAAMAHRWLSLVAERAAYWLQRQRFPHDGAFNTVQDYWTVFAIESVETIKINYSIAGSWAVARIALLVTRYQPSYPVASSTVQPTDLTKVESTLRNSFYSGSTLLGNIDVKLEDTIVP
jgi:hypothetical protein